MRVDGCVTYDVSGGHSVGYVGSTEDGSEVYLLSAEQLTGEEHDSSKDLYMWSEEGEAQGHTLSGIEGRQRRQRGEAGNSDNCEVDYVRRCGVVTYSSAKYCMLPGGAGGNCVSDNSIAETATSTSSPPSSWTARAGFRTRRTSTTSATVELNTSSP